MASGGGVGQRPLRQLLGGCLAYAAHKGISRVGSIAGKRYGGVREEDHHDADHQQCGAEEVHLGASVLGGRLVNER